MGLYTAALTALEDAWRDAAAADLLPSRYVWLTVRTLFGRGGAHREEQMRAFLTDHGLTPDLRFGDLHGVPTRLVAADLNGFRPAIFGAAADDLVQDGVLASGALPPWMHPLERNGRLLLDGGMVSSVPIEPALNAGANRDHRAGYLRAECPAKRRVRFRRVAEQTQQYAADAPI